VVRVDGGARQEAIVALKQAAVLVVSTVHDNLYEMEDLDTHRVAKRHVSHLRLFNMSRTSDIAEIEAHADASTYIVERVVKHLDEGRGTATHQVEGLAGEPGHVGASNQCA
jgi:hypothetical protein